MSNAINFIAEAVATAKQLDADSPTPWLTEFRQQRLDRFASSAWPNRKTEAFKYNNLNALSEQTLSVEPTSAELTTSDCHADIDGLACEQMVFVDGVYQADQSTLAQHKVTWFSDADEQQREWILEQLNAHDAKHLFSALNDSLLQQGLLIEFNDESPKTALKIVHIASNQPERQLTAMRHMVRVKANSQGTLVEQFVSSELTLPAIVTEKTEAFIEANAQLTHYRLQTEHSAICHLGQQIFQLERDARLHSFQLGLGSRIKRNDIDIIHLQGGSHAQLNGIYLANEQQQVDYHTNIEHAVAHCTSEEIFRGIVDDRAKAVFNGRIHIHPDAQKTLAEMSNKNLLLSNRAEINTKPELEIYADDVRCAHGATISQLNDEAVFYLRSRGIEKQQAELMLSFGFINELLDDLTDSSIADYLRPILSALFK